MLQFNKWLQSATVLLGAAVILAGCLPIGSDNNPLSELFGATTLSRTTVSQNYLEIEPNDDFIDAESLLIEEAAQLMGTIAADSLDRDLYELGPAAAGDRILVQLTVDNPGDIVLGILDDQQRVLSHLDPASRTAGPGEIDLVIRESTNQLYALVATRSTVTADNQYTASITLQRGVGIPEPAAQILVLNFQGADDVRIGYRSPVDVPPFDATNIDERFAGQTEAIIELIIEMVAEDYAGLNVDIYAAGDPDIPNSLHSVIYFGTYDSRLLGLADNIDPFNADASQAAILYTDTFALFSPLSPSVADMAQLLANVASHEAGHLLGLRHTADPNDLMDITASARQMMLDQWFGTTQLDKSVLPIGLQDAPAMLSWTLGGELLSPAKDRRAARQKAADVAGAPDDYYIPRWQLATCSGAH